MKDKVILFDYDGTLVDTESIWLKLFPIGFKKFGFDMNNEQALMMRSLGKTFRFKLFKKWYDDRMNPEIYKQIVDYLYQLLNKYLKKHPIKLMPHAKSILKVLKEKGYKIIIVSSSEKEVIENYTKKLDIYKYIDKIFTVHGVKVGKPAPDVYIKVCKELKLKPKETYAIEDCPNGVISACAAGCKTIMVPDLTKPEEKLLKKYKFRTIKALADLKKLI